jgi:arabinose-5-phosphate isomerase
MKRKNFGKLDFKKFHPSGNLGNKLKTAADIMLTKDKIPFVNENEIMKSALKILNMKKLGFLVVVNNKGLNAGVFTDGDLKRLMQKKRLIDNLKIKLFMTKNPYIVEKDTLATDILNQMNKRKITNVCVYNKSNKKRTIGVIHIHNLLNILR